MGLGSGLDSIIRDICGSLATGLRLRFVQAVHSQMLAEHAGMRASMQTMAERFASLQREAHQARTAVDDLESQLDMVQEQLPIHPCSYQDWPHELSLDSILTLEGAFGQVRSGTWARQPVAVKTLKPQDAYMVAVDPEKERSDLQWEARMLAAAAGPHVVIVKALIMEPLAIVMEILGPSLLDDSSQLCVEDVCFQLCTALSHLQQRQILHRDIKRANVLRAIRDDPSDLLLKLVDFECACYVCCAHTKAGTPTYWPPEVRSGSLYDYRSDIFAVGCLLMELPEGGHHEGLTLWLTQASFTDRPYADEVLDSLAASEA